MVCVWDIHCSGLTRTQQKSCRASFALSARVAHFTVATYSGSKCQPLLSPLRHLQRIKVPASSVTPPPPTADQSASLFCHPSATYSGSKCQPLLSPLRHLLWIKVTASSLTPPPPTVDQGDSLFCHPSATYSGS